jgi:hypothetical protein
VRSPAALHRGWDGVRSTAQPDLRHITTMARTASPREIHPKIHPKQYTQLQGANWVVPPPIRAAPGARATCTAVLVGVFEAHPPLGTTPGVPGRELAAVPEIAINPLDEAFSICIQTGG